MMKRTTHHLSEVRHLLALLAVAATLALAATLVPPVSTAGAIESPTGFSGPGIISPGDPVEPRSTTCVDYPLQSDDTSNAHFAERIDLLETWQWNNQGINDNEGFLAPIPPGYPGAGEVENIYPSAAFVWYSGNINRLSIWNDIFADFAPGTQGNATTSAPVDLVAQENLIEICAVYHYIYADGTELNPQGPIRVNPVTKLVEFNTASAGGGTLTSGLVYVGQFIHLDNCLAGTEDPGEQPDLNALLATDAAFCFSVFADDHGYWPAWRDAHLADPDPGPGNSGTNPEDVNQGNGDDHQAELIGDTWYCFGEPADIVGDENDNYLVGDHNDNVIVGLGGDDYIHGSGGNDKICGGDGVDTLWGGSENDNIHGGLDGDFIYGGSGNDELWGAQGGDRMRGGGWSDKIHGGDDNDSITGDERHDDIWGGAGDDEIDGNAGRDDIWGGAGYDTVNGGTGRDDCDTDVEERRSCRLTIL